MAKDMKSYKYHGMWAEDTKDIENGVNDVDDLITGFIRTNKASISFNGAWAQNINKADTFVDFCGDKAGARLSYGGKFEFYDGQTLETITPEFEQTESFYYLEDDAFLKAIYTGEKNKNHISNILESMKLLDMLYASAAEVKNY